MIRHGDMIEDGDKEPPGDVPDGELDEPAPAAAAEAVVDSAPVPAASAEPASQPAPASPEPERTIEETEAPVSGTVTAEVLVPVVAADPQETAEAAPTPAETTAVDRPSPETPQNDTAALEQPTADADPAASPPEIPVPIAAAPEAVAALATEAPAETPAPPAAPEPPPAPAPETSAPVPASSPPLLLPRRLPDFLEYAGWRLLETVGTLAAAAVLIMLLLPTTTSPDWSALGERLAVTMPLLGISLLIGGGFGAALGVIAIRLGGRAGGAVAFLAELGTSVSSLVLGLLLVLVVGGMMAWLPPGGFVPWEQDVGGALLSLLLPAVALGLPLALTLAAALWRAARPGLSDTVISAAADRGLDRRTAIAQIVLPTAWAGVWPALIVPLALLPVLAVIVETAFYLPGLSRLLFGAIAARDIAGLQLALLTVAALVALCRFIGELMRGACNPLLTDR